MKKDAQTKSDPKNPDKSEPEPSTKLDDQNEENPQPPLKNHFIFCGSTKWDLLGRKVIPKAVLKNGGSEAGSELLGPTRLLFTGLPTATTFAKVFSGCAAAHLVLIDTAGAAYGLGRNDVGQLALPDLRSRHHPVRFSLPDASPDETVVHAACGRSHTILITSAGRALAAGHNVFGQLGNGSRTELKKPHVASWQTMKLPSSEKAVCAGAGAEFSVLVCENGAVYCMGSGQYGQLGNGRTGECIESRNRIAYDVIMQPLRVAGFGSGESEVQVAQVACGVSHTIALDKEGKVWSWGFGGYGRLGHKLPKDELRPRRIEAFTSPAFHLDLVACGQTSSFAVQHNRKTCYTWGMLKRTGECNMYPKPEFELQGWVVRSVACGSTSTAVAAERSLISWGPSPTFGELGYGEGKPKSSTKPKVMESLEGLIGTQVAAGLAFTAILVRIEDEKDQKIFDALPTLEIEDEEEADAPVGGEKRKAASKSNGKPKATAKKKRRR